MAENIRKPTSQELKEQFVFDDFRYEPIDPNHENAIITIDTRKSEIIEKVKGEDDLWEFLASNPQETVEASLEFENWLLATSISYTNGVPHIMIRLIDGAWYRSRIEEMKKIFTNEARIGHCYNTKVIAENANVTAVQKIEILPKEFSPSETQDALGKGLDLNTRELIRYLNMIGLKTNQSCGGHWHGSKPYLDFEGDQLEEVLGHVLSWNEELDFDWLLLPLGYHVSSIRLEPPMGKSRLEAQRDLDRLCNWLSKQVKFPKRALSIPELGERVRRKISRTIR